MVDLHTHTTASDGSLTPTELVEKAAAMGLKYLAVTDHDTVAGVAEAMEAAKRHDITFIPGIELSTVQDGHSVDMLGYGIDPTHPQLLEVLDKVIKHRQERIFEMVDKLKGLRIPIDRQTVHRLSENGAPGRPHVAMALVQVGVVDTVKEAFTRYIGRNKPGFVPKNNLPSEEAIELIRKAGGIPVLAHPRFLRMEKDVFLPFIDKLRGYGLLGLEVYYSIHNEEDVERYRSIAQAKNLVMTGGSDYHGTSKPDIRLGLGPLGERLEESIALDVLTALQELKSSTQK